MIDLHCHPLWGVDDGAETFEVAVEMCKMAAADGITHLVATPHCNYTYRFQPEVNRQRLQELQEAAGESPKLLLGCDFNLSIDNIRQVVQDHAVYTINRTSYLLVEFAHEFNPSQFEQVLYEIQLAGLTPILTHPERNPVFRRKTDLLYRWVSRGCLVQVTAQSYLGGFGSTAQRVSETWLERNLIHFFATDAHDLERRPPLLSPCYQKLEMVRGKEMPSCFSASSQRPWSGARLCPTGQGRLDRRLRGPASEAGFTFSDARNSGILHSRWMAPKINAED